MIRAVCRLALLAGIALVSTAHVGSPDAWFEGSAGPYRVTVHIEAPLVVPGIAVVNVRATDSVERITAFVNTFDAEGGTPPPDELRPAADRPGWRRASLWVMNAGSNRVTIEVHGPRGRGDVVVPLAAVAQRRLAISGPFILAVIAGGTILVAGMLTLVGAMVREGVLAPGKVPDEERRRRARRAMLRATAVIALVLAGTTYWWRAEDRAFQRRLYRPLEISTRVDTTGGTARLILAITDSAWLNRDDVALVRARGELPSAGLIDDHGKLMHLFLVATAGSAMAHLHPATTDTVTFTSLLPPLPGGSYRVFADIVHQSGFTQTLVSELVMPGTRGDEAAPLTDIDDSWAVASSDSARVTLQDGTGLVWDRDSLPLRAGTEAGLRFLVTSRSNGSAALEPYLGMPGHAAVIRDDGQVFIHLHPMGTISPAAQARLASNQHGSGHSPPPATTFPDTLRFPYAFPDAGRYTVWVQLKREGRVLTGAFRAEVQPAR
ncbi:MAG TPA: hypothetical protein VFZ73_03900 [Gemmatimonadaceae bacterium]